MTTAKRRGRPPAPKTKKKAKSSSKDNSEKTSTNVKSSNKDTPKDSPTETNNDDTNGSGSNTISDVTKAVNDNDNEDGDDSVDVFSTQETQPDEHFLWCSSEEELKHALGSSSSNCSEDEDEEIGVSRRTTKNKKIKNTSAPAKSSIKAAAKAATTTKTSETASETTSVTESAASVATEKAIDATPKPKTAALQRPRRKAATAPSYQYDIPESAATSIVSTVTVTDTTKSTKHNVDPNEAVDLEETMPLSQLILLNNRKRKNHTPLNASTAKNVTSNHSEDQNKKTHKKTSTTKRGRKKSKIIPDSESIEKQKLHAYDDEDEDEFQVTVKLAGTKKKVSMIGRRSLRAATITNLLSSNIIDIDVPSPQSSLNKIDFNSSDIENLKTKKSSTSRLLKKDYKKSLIPETIRTDLDKQENKSRGMVKYDNVIVLNLSDDESCNESKQNENANEENHMELVDIKIDQAEETVDQDAKETPYAQSNLKEETTEPKKKKQSPPKKRKVNDNLNPKNNDSHVKTITKIIARRLKVNVSSGLDDKSPLPTVEYLVQYDDAENSSAWKTEESIDNCILSEYQKMWKDIVQPKKVGEIQYLPNNDDDDDCIIVDKPVEQTGNDSAISDNDSIASSEILTANKVHVDNDDAPVDKFLPGVSDKSELNTPITVGENESSKQNNTKDDDPINSYDGDREKKLDGQRIIDESHAASETIETDNDNCGSPTIERPVQFRHFAEENDHESVEFVITSSDDPVKSTIGGVRKSSDGDLTIDCIPFKDTPSDFTDNTKDSKSQTKNERTKKPKPKKPRTRTCPICFNVFVPYGFSMHLKKCQKYANWECDFCHIKWNNAMSQLTLHNGPNGAKTLCPDCGRKYAEELKEKEKNTDQDGGTKIKKHSTAKKSIGHLAENKDDPIKLPVNVIDVNETEEEEDIGDDDDDIDDDDIDDEDDEDEEDEEDVDQSKESSRSHKLPISQTKSDNIIPIAKNLDSELEPVITQNRSSVRLARKSAFKKIGLVNDDLEPHSVTWTTELESSLLLIILKNPQRVLHSGVGLWVLDSKDPELNCKVTKKELSSHWHKMLKRSARNENYNIVNSLDATPVNCRATLVLAACFACESPAARAVALLSVGWHCVESDVVKEEMANSGEKNSISETNSLDDGYDQTRWHRPSVTWKLLRNLSRSDYVGASISLEKAWAEHLSELEKGFSDNLVNNYDANMDLDMSEANHSMDSNEENGKSQTEEIESKDSNKDHFERFRLDNDGKVDFSLVPKNILTMMEKRKKLVLAGDPRPSIVCNWCGPKWFRKNTPKQHLKGNKDPDAPSCEACLMLYDIGWRIFGISKDNLQKKPRSHYNDYRYLGPNGENLRSVRTYLIHTSKIVIKALGLDKKKKSSSTKINDETKGPTSGTSKKLTVHTSEDHSNRSAKKATKEILKESPKKTTIESHKGTKMSRTNEFVEDVPKEATKDHIKYTTKEACSSSETQTDISSEKFDDDDSEIVPLPTIIQLFESPGGLEGALQLDDLRLWNTFYGTDLSVALTALEPLIKGQLPFIVQFEAPFLRPTEELFTFPKDPVGPPPTRFLGVKRVMERIQISNGTGQDFVDRATGKFGVEFPYFDRNLEDGREAGEINNHLPRCAKIGGSKILLRNDLDREDVAGQLYSFVYRLLFGKKKADELRLKLNYSNGTSDMRKDPYLLQSTLFAFGARPHPVALDPVFPTPS